MSNSKNSKKGQQLQTSKELGRGVNQITATRAEFHAGPLPHPSIMSGYEEICPGAADRIISMAERQSEHRQSLETRVIEINGRNSLLGIIAGVVISLIAMGCGTFLMLKGLNIQGFSLTGGALVSLVTVFIYGTNSNRKERESKSDR